MGPEHEPPGRGKQEKDRESRARQGVEAGKVPGAEEREEEEQGVRYLRGLHVVRPQEAEGSLGGEAKQRVGPEVDGVGATGCVESVVRAEDTIDPSRTPCGGQRGQVLAPQLGRAVAVERLDHEEVLAGVSVGVGLDEKRGH